VSLIDDALKRAHAAGEAAPSRTGDRPRIPTPMPDAGLARRRTLMRLLGMALAAAVVAAVATFVIRRAGGSAEPARKSTAPAEAHAATPSIPTPVQEVVLVPTPMSTTPERPTRIRPASPELATGAEVAEVAPPPASPSSRPAAPAGAKSYVGSVALPGGSRIELGGIVWSETEPRALLNDRIVATGAFVEGFSVVKIEENRVVLEKDGATISLSLK
jgi:hypothetical protein